MTSLQAARSGRWRRLRRDWLRACVHLSNECATVTVHDDGGIYKRLRSRHHTLDAEELPLRRGSASETVSVLLRDYRMLAHDDGEGRPLRFMSLYGGMVTKML
jgi:hypothetical protein